MPFPYQASAQPVRTRRIKDRDGRSVNSRSDSVKKPRESSSNNRTPPHSLRPAQPSLYTQHNVTLDQLPALPGSRTTSPTPPSPSSHAASSIPAAPSASIPVPAAPTITQAQIHTPAALQPYLDQEDDNEPDVTDALPSTSSKNFFLTEEHSGSPESHNQPLQVLPLIPHSTPSPTAAKAAVFRAPSPPPQAPSPIWKQTYSDPLQSNQQYNGPPHFDPTQAYSQNLNFVASPPSFAPAVPFLGGTNEHYYGSSYSGQSYVPMTQSTGNPPDHQLSQPQPVPYYANFGPPQLIQAPYHSIRSSSTRGRSSRRSFSGETFPVLPATMAKPPEQQLTNDESISNPQGSEDESVELLHRIQSAIPDLHLLLNRYKETSGQLGVRETLIRETEAQKAAALKQKEAYIEKLGKELENVTSKHSAESSKLRLEIGNMDEKHKELQDKLSTEKKIKEDLEEVNRALRTEKEEAERKLQEGTAAFEQDRMAWQQKTLLDQAARQAAWEIDSQQQKHELELKWRAREAKLNESWSQEKAALQAGWTKQKREIEDSHVRLRRDLEATLDLRQRAIEESRQKQLKDRETWEREREELARNWDEERAMLGKGSEEQRAILGTQHEREKNEVRKEWEVSLERAKKQAEETQTTLQKENERLKAGWDADKAKFSKAVMDLKITAAELNDQNAKLQKMAEAFGDITDLKSREDPFYDDAFHHLHKQVLDLTLEHFGDSIDPPPKAVINRIPGTVPPFFSSSKASIKLRAAYIEHLISSVITRRVFKPFLFTISLRHGSPDKLFQSWSDHMRNKSTRREALWRQRTLHAAYTASCAKQSINRVAASIVDEIIDAIKYFSKPNRWEQLTMAVRRIVKTAAETWRYARLEFAMITASMSEEERPGFMRSNGTGGLPTATQITLNQRPILLPLFPIIEREAIHEDIRQNSKVSDNGYTYFPGRVLYADDPIVTDCVTESQNKSVSAASAETTNAITNSENKNLAPKMNIGYKSTVVSTSLLPGKQSGSQHIDPPFTSTGARADIWEGIDMDSKLAYRNQGDESKRKASDESGGHTPPLSHSSETSGSSTWRSSSTTRPDGLPHLGNKEGIDRDREGYGRW